MPRTSGWAGRLAALARGGWIFVPVAFLYVYSFPYFERLNNPNELVRVYMTMSMVDDASYDIEPQCRRFGWLNDRSVVGKRAYSSKAPGASFAGVPFYLAAKALAGLRGVPLSRGQIVWWLRLTVCVIPTLVFLVAFRRFLASLGRSGFLTDSVFLATALGSPVFIYAHQFAGHTPSACCLFGAFMLLWRARRMGRFHPAGAAAFGFLLAWAPVMEYQALVPSALVGLAFLASRPARRPAPLALALAGAALPALLLVHFHTSAFGSPLRTGYAYIENPAFQAMLAEGWMGLTHPKLSRLLLLTLSPECGLVFFSPFLVFALLLAPLVPALVRAPGWDAERWRTVLMSAAVVVSLVLFISANSLWRAGWSAGPRYLTALVPSAAVLALEGMAEAERIWGWTVRAIVLASTFLALAFSGTAAVIYPHLPVTFPSPVFQILFPLVADGFFPANLGRSLLGLRGAMGFVPALVLGALPLVAALVVRSDARPLRQAWVLASGALVALLAVQSLGSAAARAPMPAWGLDEIAAITTSWEPVDGLAFLERNGCSADRTLWLVRCKDPLARGRMLMRLGLKGQALQQYGSFPRPGAVRSSAGGSG